MVPNLKPTVVDTKVAQSPIVTGGGGLTRTDGTNRRHWLRTMPPRKPQGKHTVLIDDPLPYGFAELWIDLHPALAAVLAAEGLANGDYHDARKLANQRFITLKDDDETRLRWLTETHQYIQLHKDRERQKTLIEK